MAQSACSRADLGGGELPIFERWATKPKLSARQHQAHAPKKGFAALECECLESDKPGDNLAHFLRIELEA